MSLTLDTPVNAPTRSADRYVVMDALRGFALLGVMMINLYEFGGIDVLITAEQLAALPSAALDQRVEFWLRLLVVDKANTLFAFLFGLGFWIQMERLEARGAPFRSIYLRRAGILLILGWIHLLGLFSWDILHVYGITAFLLFACRKLPDRTLLWIGIILLMFARPLVTWLFELGGLAYGSEDPAVTNAGVLSRQAAAQSGDFVHFMGLMNRDYLAWFLAGGLLGWIFYALGRFFMGAWVGRRGWIQNASDHLSLFRRGLWPLLLTGLLLELVHLWTADLPEGAWFGQLELLRTVLHVVATPLLAAGYICAIVLLFHSPRLRWLVKPFAPVGQMALSNYLSQSVAIILILTAVGPGLGLAGKAAASTFVPLVLAFFLLQIVVSYFWMKVFAFGPAEWLWRTLTYGSRPRFLRRAPRSSA
ncbi:DUF418 domain-containing protein [Wenzhouxiangella marina]|uniref:Uncharacterized protein n=1 Tax=Wenzhouxiangella marina TaxID=1579979 RepID=A0A0K0XU33_9GAMM|nr:DUF418 domain-containing protein [Wenzhouxiangella marina]AKS41199.1 hypothetical protein WM2015_818 [Wenzhouxiangella marina]MBB6088078.1 uncharacterized protein [Wenzhouxiangella marina]